MLPLRRDHTLLKLNITFSGTYWISLENLKRPGYVGWRESCLSPARSSQGQLLGRAHSTTPLQFLGRCNLYFALTSAASRATAVWVILRVERLVSFIKEHGPCPQVFLQSGGWLEQIA